MRSWRRSRRAEGRPEARRARARGALAALDGPANARRDQGSPRVAARPRGPRRGARARRGRARPRRAHRADVLADVRSMSGASETYDAAMVLCAGPRHTPPAAHRGAREADGPGRRRAGARARGRSRPARGAVAHRRQRASSSGRRTRVGRAGGDRGVARARAPRHRRRRRARRRRCSAKATSSCGTATSSSELDPRELVRPMRRGPCGQRHGHRSRDARRASAAGRGGERRLRETMAASCGCGARASAPRHTAADFLGIHVIGAALRALLPERGCLVGDVYLPALRRGERLRRVRDRRIVRRRRLGRAVPRSQCALAVVARAHVVGAPHRDRQRVDRRLGGGRRRGRRCAGSRERRVAGRTRAVCMQLRGRHAAHDDTGASAAPVTAGVRALRLLRVLLDRRRSTDDRRPCPSPVARSAAHSGAAP